MDIASGTLIRAPSSSTVLCVANWTLQEREKAAEEEAAREHDIALGNPLLNTKSDFNVKRRWDDDVIFKNQARGTDEKGKKKEFVNVGLFQKKICRVILLMRSRICFARISTSVS